MRSLFPAVLLAAALVASACTESTTPSAEGRSDGSSIVVADAQEPSTLNPLLGYGERGASKIYEGLVEHGADRSLRPELASELPKPSPDGLTWTVKLRDAVKFTDATTFGAEDVVATYRALLDPAAGSTERASFAMLSGVQQLDAHTVRFTLSQPYAAFPHLLVLGILPSEALARGGALKDNPIDKTPIGTGPYRLTDWRKGDRMVLEANTGHSGGTPAIKKLTVVFVPDDNSRAQRMQSGEFDGTTLPPRLATVFASTSGMKVISHRSADFRAISLPTANPVTGDRSMRLALNLAVNRAGMVSGLLAGKAVAASTPIPDVLPEFVEPGAEFRYDKIEAERQLDLGGWVKGVDGMRSKGGTPARFTLMYPVGDAMRSDLATAFAAEARVVGVDVQLAGLSWTAITPRFGQDAVIYGDGNPFDPDLTAWPALHSTSTPSGFDNPGGYVNPQVDAALDAGRTLTDPAQRAAAYRQFQRAYLAEPGAVFLAFLDHTYVVRDNWNGYQEVVDPHSVGALAWGPWWNLEKWTPK